jgi:hypothetical protein
MDSYNTDTERTGNYIKDHWLGNLSLPVSYWINGSLISGVAAIVLVALTSEIERSSLSLQLFALSSVALSFATLVIWAWGIVGIWRSSSRHAERGGSSVWATIAKGMVIVGSLNVAGQLSASSLQLIEASRLALGSDPIGEPATISVQGRTISIDGWLTAGTAQRFSSVLDANVEVNQLTLTSPGGRLREAVDIAAVVKSRRMSTTVLSECSSACTLIFLASESRFLEADSSIGFHSPSGTGVSDDEARSSTPSMQLAYERVGLPAEFIERALTTPSTSLWLPTDEELVLSGVVNRFAPSLVQKYHLAEIQFLQEGGPTEIDEYTTATSATVDSLALTVNYSINVPSSSIDWESLSIEMLNFSRESACSDPILKTIIASDGSFIYKYIDVDGAFLGTLTVDAC